MSKYFEDPVSYFLRTPCPIFDYPVSKILKFNQILIKTILKNPKIPSLLSADAGNIGTMRPYPLAPLSVGSAGQIEDRRSEKSENKKFPELGLPGVEILNGACTSILHLSRGSQSPYSEKTKKRKIIQNVDSAYLLPIFPVWSQPMGAHGNFWGLTLSSWFEGVC